MLRRPESYINSDFNDSFDDIFSDFCDNNSKLCKEKESPVQDLLTRRVTRSNSKQLQISALIISPDALNSRRTNSRHKRKSENSSFNNSKICIADKAHTNIDEITNDILSIQNVEYKNTSVNETAVSPDIFIKRPSVTKHPNNETQVNNDISGNDILSEKENVIDLSELNETKLLDKSKAEDCNGKLKVGRKQSQIIKDHSSKMHVLDSFFDELLNVDKPIIPKPISSIKGAHNIGVDTIKDMASEINVHEIKVHEIEPLNRDKLNNVSNNTLLKNILNTSTSANSLVTDCYNVNAQINRSANCVQNSDVINNNQQNNNILNTQLSNRPSRYFTSLSARIKNVLKSNCRNLGPVKSDLLHRFEDVENDVKTVLTEKDNGFYGLPERVKRLFHKQRKIERLYEWQEECLKLDIETNSGNLIYTLPTSGGKTLVAEMLILRQLLLKEKDVLFIMPFVAIVQEKFRNMSLFASELGFSVEEYAGGKGAFPPRMRRHKNTLYIATIEKAAGLINSLIGLQRINELGLVVVDELHMVGEKGGRGAILETLLALLLHCTDKCQVIGMSATLNNINELCQFLKAKLYTNDFRPVQLCENIKLDCDIFQIDKRHNIDIDEKVKYSRSVNFNYSKEMYQLDRDCIAGLVLEVIPQNSCLVFCPTKKKKVPTATLR